jgi:CRP-like cAMP-binding protein
MYELLVKHISERTGITASDFEAAKYSFIPKKLRRRQYLLQEGDTCKYNAFISKGSLRSYITDTKGQEVILKLPLENEWVTDYEGFATGKPSIMHIDALEDSELLLIDRKSWDDLCATTPWFERYVRLMLEESAVANQYRTIANISYPADSRYSCFARNYPEVVQRVPQHMIASYLGMSAETLSRLRKQSID